MIEVSDDDDDHYEDDEDCDSAIMVACVAY